MSVQSSWRFCSKCFSMFFAGNSSQGVCPAQGSHLDQGFDFALPFNVPDSAGQAEWRFCIKCEALFYQGLPPAPGQPESPVGVCPSGGTHLPEGLQFVLPHDISPTTESQTAWNYCSKCRVLFFGGFASQGVCAAGGAHLGQNSYMYVVPFGEAGWEPMPPKGLGSSSNYFIDAFCNPITQLIIRIAITEELYAADGWSFQLNCYSPPGHVAQWQQYVIVLPPPGFFQATLKAQINNWGSSLTVPLIDSEVSMDTISLALLPTQWLQIDLIFDNEANVTGGNFVYGGIDGTITRKTINIQPGQPIAPIIGFQLNLVGPYDGITTNFSSGAGTITSIGAPDLRVQNARPSCAMSTFITLEQGNSFYGPLPASGGGEMVQSFNTSSVVPMIERVSNEPAPSRKQ